MNKIILDAARDEVEVRYMRWRLHPKLFDLLREPMLRLILAWAVI